MIESLCQAREMKKTFELIHPKIKYPRLVEAVRRDVKKYVKRECRKTLPEGFDFWAFDCKFGPTEADAKVIHVAEFSQYITTAEKEELTSFYIEILAKPAKRQKKQGAVAKGGQAMPEA